MTSEDGFNYKLSDSEITNWMKQYGEIKPELEEVAISRDGDGAIVGTGSYTLKVRLRRLIKCSYQGVKNNVTTAIYYIKDTKRGVKELQQM